ncbi:hypothetical protein ACOME3_010238 [Neoechinorhynchus agilis]
MESPVGAAIQQVTNTGHILRQAYLILLLALGLPGNVLVIILAKGKEFSKTPSSMYLVLLAISDTTYLIVLFLLVLTREGITVLNSPVVCPVSVYPNDLP